ncbi:hypothetical protein [Lentibacillus halodurans]|uniref:hypothetical protein n=1 Tax=Lentibacillus halodurans TaxID=237679 RepID=UPI000B7E381A|nr:hypothetical protein [Lentibacillus halodurans]
MAKLNKQLPSFPVAANHYEEAIEQLELAKDQELLENALADVIAFFYHIVIKGKSGHIKINLFN